MGNNLPPMDPRHRRNAPWNEDGPDEAPICLRCEDDDDDATYGVEDPETAVGGEDEQAYCDKHGYLDPDEWEFIPL